MLILSIMVSFYLMRGSTPASPTIIDVTAFITDIQNLDELNEEVQVDAIFQYEWEDSRLTYNEQKVGKNINCTRVIFNMMKSMKVGAHKYL